MAAKKKYQDSKGLLSAKGAYANMPAESKTMNWSAGAGYLPEGYDDTMYGIDDKMAQDINGARKQFKPKNW